MEKIANAAKFVAVVFTTPYFILNSFPNVGEYNHRNILRVIPCAMKGEKFFDLRTGEEVVLKGNYQIWPVLSGTVFMYPDSECYLVTRYYSDGGNFTYLKMDNIQDFHPSSMVMHRLRAKREI